MNALINISEQNGNKVVSARELYDVLGYDSSQWKRWYEKNIIKNDFAIESIDYEVIDMMSKSPEGGRPTKDFALLLDFAKRISMMARTEKGEIARNYFIECEKQLKNKVFKLPQSYSEALRLLADTAEQKEKAVLRLKQAEETIQQNKSKVVFADSVKGSNNSILIRQFAKDLSDNNFKIGQNRVFDWLRVNRYMNSKNEPYQQYVEQDLFEVITRTIGDGDSTIQVKTTKITGKGSIYFAKKIKEAFDPLKPTA